MAPLGNRPARGAKAALLPLFVALLAARPSLANPFLGLRALRTAASAAVSSLGSGSKESSSEAAASPAKESSPILVKLWAASLPSAGRLAAKVPLDADEVFYVGKVNVGRPHAQEFTVLFDTAAGNLILPSAGCDNKTCLDRRRYSPGTSPSARPVSLTAKPLEGAVTSDILDIDFDQIELGTGQVSGDLYRDAVCLQPSTASSGGSNADSACADLGLVAATEFSQVPFGLMPHDGMFGLGLDGLTAASPLFSFIRRLSSSAPGASLQSHFSLSLRGPSAELAFGGLGPAFSRASPPVWRNVVQVEEGYWQVRIHAIRVGNVTVDRCEQGCRGIVDTGAARLGVPAALVTKLGAALADTPSGTGSSGAGCSGPDLQLDLGGGESLTLRAADYSGPSCGSPRLSPLNLGEGFEGVIVLGLSVLRRYDTIYDWGSLRVGFSLSAPRAVRLGSASLVGEEADRALPLSEKAVGGGDVLAFV